MIATGQQFLPMTVKGLVIAFLLLQEACGDIQLDNHNRIYHSFPTHPRVDKPINNGFAAGECCMLFDHFEIPIGSSATFNSPNFPKSYPSDMTCGWNFTTDSAYTFDMHCHFSHLKRNDFISMLDRHYSLYSYIENVREKEVFYYFRSNSVQVGFHSDDVMSAKGFECTIWPVSSQCNVSNEVVPETTTGQTGECNSEQFTCDSGECVRWDDRCDEEDDCDDGSDELNCGCNSWQFTCQKGGECLQWKNKCNGKDDCRDGSDELDCGCNSEQFTCASGECVRWDDKCDEEDDCDDGSDELNCGCNSIEFICHTEGECVHMDVECDGKDDCRDGSDELSCPPPQQ